MKNLKAKNENERSINMEKVFQECLLEYLRTLSPFKKEVTVELIKNEKSENLAIRYSERNKMSLRVARAHISRAEQGLKKFVSKVFNVFKSEEVYWSTFRDGVLLIHYKIKNEIGYTVGSEDINIEALKTFLESQVEIKIN